MMKTVVCSVVALTVAALVLPTPAQKDFDFFLLVRYVFFITSSVGYADVIWNHHLSCVDNSLQPCVNQKVALEIPSVNLQFMVSGQSMPMADTQAIVRMIRSQSNLWRRIH